MKNPKHHPLWKKFVAFMREFSPDSLTHGDDWADWWRCFLEGAKASLEVEGERGNGKVQTVQGKAEA